VHLRVLLNRNLAIGAAVIFVAGGIMNGTTAILPQFLQNLMNYTALQAGLVISPRGLGAIAGTLLAGRILSKLDGRAFIAQGALLLALSMYWLGSINLSIAPGNLLWPIILSGFAVAAIFVPITTFSVSTVSRQQMGDATGLTSLLRNLGGSVGISMLTNLVTRGTQAHQALMVGHLTPYAPAFRNQLAVLQHHLAAQGAPPVAAQHQAYGLIYEKLQQQASLWAYLDQFRLLALACAVLVPLVFLFKKSSQPLPEGAAMGH
jgi:DHA2 family multidrug resistance protein